MVREILMPLDLKNQTWSSKDPEANKTTTTLSTSLTPKRIHSITQTMPTVIIEEIEHGRELNPKSTRQETLDDYSCGSFSLLVWFKMLNCMEDETYLHIFLKLRMYILFITALNVYDSNN